MSNLSDKTILLIDDDASLLRALKKVLSDAGAHVICATWAGEAIELLTSRQMRVDLVITDLRMPRVTGLTVLPAVRQVFPTLPVVVLTALSDPELQDACRREGAAAVLEKPVDTPHLLVTLGRIVGRAPALASP